MHYLGLYNSILSIAELKFPIKNMPPQRLLFLKTTSAHTTLYKTKLYKDGGFGTDGGVGSDGGVGKGGGVGSC